MAVGVALRVLVLHSNLATLDSDEAVVGLMARHLTHGGFRAFYWGQDYGGTMEAALAAVVFRVAGSSTLALKTVPMALDGVATMLLWRIGRRLMAPGPAAVAGLLMWVWPANYLWWSTKERGFYQSCLCLGLAFALVALRIAASQAGGPWREWAVLGLLAGLGWWQSPQVVYVLAPATAWLAWRLRARTFRVIAAVPGFALGALPWLWANVQDGLASLSPPPSPVKQGYLGHLSVLVRTGLPTTLGLRVAYTAHQWVGPQPAGIALYVVALALVVAACIRRWPGGRLAVAVVVVFPFVHSLLTLGGTVAEGRYTLFALPWLALALAHGADRKLAAAALAVVVLAVSGAGLIDMRDQTSPFVSGRRVPRSLAALERGLEAHGTTRVWADYWIAYRVTFETGERVIAAPVTDDRYPPFRALVSATPAAHVFLTGSASDRNFSAGLDARHVAYERWAAGPEWVVYVPDAPVGPTDIPGSYP